MKTYVNNEKKTITIEFTLREALVTQRELVWAAVGANTTVYQALAVVLSFAPPDVVVETLRQVTEATGHVTTPLLNLTIAARELASITPNEELKANLFSESE